MKYIDAITQEMQWLASKKDTVFIGEGITNAGRIYHTLDKVPLRKCIETPIAENLISGIAIGLALEGYQPIVVFQRMDFMLIAADAIINHMALMPKMSGGQFTLPIIIRTIIGSQSRKFWVGEQHNHDFEHVFKPYVKILHYTSDFYKLAYGFLEPVIVIERKDDYSGRVGL